MTNVINIKTAAQHRDRLEAYHLAESVLDIYEGVFKDDKRPRFALTAAHDYAKGMVGIEALANARKWALAAINDAAYCAVKADYSAAWTMHPAIMAAYTVYFTLEHEIDLSMVQQKAEEAMRFAENRRAN